MEKIIKQAKEVFSKERFDEFAQLMYSGDEYGAARVAANELKLIKRKLLLDIENYNCNFDLMHKYKQTKSIIDKMSNLND